MKFLDKLSEINDIIIYELYVAQWYWSGQD